PSRQLYASLARSLRASPSLLPLASPAARLRAGLSRRRHALLARLRLRDPWPLAWPFQQARRALWPCCSPPCPQPHFWRHRALRSLQRPRASPPPALPHLRQNDVAPRRLLTPLRRLRAWRRSRLLSLQQPPAPEC